MAIKKFVQVIVKFKEDGRIIPLQVLWEDGRVFTIDRILRYAPGGLSEGRRTGDSLHLPDPE